MKQPINMISLSALALAPGEVLVVATTRGLPAVDRAKLERDLTAALWGKPNTFILLENIQQLAKYAPSNPNGESLRKSDAGRPEPQVGK